MKLTKPVWTGSWSLLYESSFLVAESVRGPASGTDCEVSSLPIGMSRFYHCLRKSFSINMKGTIICVYPISRILGEVIPILPNLFCGDCHFVCEACRRAKGGGPTHRKNILPHLKFLNAVIWVWADPKYFLCQPFTRLKVPLPAFHERPSRDGHFIWSSFWVLKEETRLC